MKSYLRIGLAVALVIFLSMVSASRGKSPSFVEMDVKGVKVDSFGQTPVVVLVDKEGKIALPIWIGPLEAGAIDRELNGVTTARPMTHDLFHSVLGLLKAKVKEVKIVSLKDLTFYGLLVLGVDQEVIEVDARPSDAIILALKSKAPISVATEVLEAQGISLVLKEGFGERHGIRVQELTPALASQFNFKGKTGVLVSEIVSGSAAEASGIRAGDIITKINGKEVASVQEFEGTFDTLKEANRVALSIFRGDQWIEMNLTLKH
jgi:bifunctional DNase/RNase